MKYTVLLLYPDYIADTFGHDTYMAHVAAKSPKAAIKEAQREAYAGTSGCEGRADFHPLLVIHGWHDDVNPS